MNVFVSISDIIVVSSHDFLFTIFRLMGLQSLRCWPQPSIKNLTPYPLVRHQERVLVVVNLHQTMIHTLKGECLE